VGRHEEPRRAALSGRRVSACGEASRAAEFARVRALTAVERMALALALGERRRALAALRAGLREGDG
jgi:hypothetical protein